MMGDITVPATTGARLQAVVRRVPGQAAIAVIALVGIGISIYLTIEHYHKAILVCNVNSVINCASVLTSAYSVVPGTTIPITIPGMLWFVVSGALAGTALVCTWRRVAPPAWLLTAQRAWGGLGLLTVFYLVYAEFDKIHNICEWCTGVHILVLITFLTTLWMREAAPIPAPVKKKAAAKAARPHPVASREPYPPTPPVAASRRGTGTLQESPSPSADGEGEKVARVTTSHGARPVATNGARSVATNGTPPAAARGSPQPATNSRGPAAGGKPRSSSAAHSAHSKRRAAKRGGR
jgi:uncharacterized membrane protein